MSSSEHPPPLALSDIMHHMSPSPVSGEENQRSPPGSSSGQMQARSDRDLSPEPLEELELVNMRKRLHEMGILTTSSTPETGESSVKHSTVANNASSREMELVNMILRLMSSPRIDSAQLEQQATTISHLTLQQDMLIAQAEENHQRWQSERESWDRSAEALLSQKARMPKSEDSERQRASYDAEIKILRDKLHDRHRRLITLEQEILRLKPLLLMQPYPTSRVKQALSSHPSKFHDKGKRREVEPVALQLRSIPEDMDAYHNRNHPHQHSPQKFDPAAYPYGYQYNPDAPAPSALPSQSQPQQPQALPLQPAILPPPPSSHPFLFEGQPPPSPAPPHRRSKDHANVRHSHKSKKHKSQRAAPLSSDAYAEHVLLAAQRIGRKRANLVTGLQRMADREREVMVKEQEYFLYKKAERVAGSSGSMSYYRPPGEAGSSSPQRDAGGVGVSSGPKQPKTPKRGYPAAFGVVGPNNNANPGGVNTPPPSTYVFVNTSAAPVSLSKYPLAVGGSYSPGHGNGNLLNTPSHLGAPVNLPSTRGMGMGSNPPTPLDSLVDAARSMMDEDEESGVDHNARGLRGIGRRRPLEEPDSPMAKRRKVSAVKSLEVGLSGLSRGGGATPRLDRVRSALDVLADQAAAAVNEQPPPPHSDPAAGASDDNIGPKTKGKAKPKPKARAKPKAKAVNRDESKAAASSLSTSRASPNPRSSTRTIRQTSRKRGLSPELSVTSTSTSASTSGQLETGTGKVGVRTRGRPKAIVATATGAGASSATLSASASALASGSGSRVIAGPGNVVLQPGNYDGAGVPRLGLRPVVAWGSRPDAPDEDDEDEEEEEEEDSPSGKGLRHRADDGRAQNNAPTGLGPSEEEEEDPRGSNSDGYRDSRMNGLPVLPARLKRAQSRDESFVNGLGSNTAIPTPTSPSPSPPIPTMQQPILQRNQSPSRLIPAASLLTPRLSSGPAAANPDAAFPARQSSPLRLNPIPNPNPPLPISITVQDPPRASPHAETNQSPPAEKTAANLRAEAMDDDEDEDAEGEEEDDVQEEDVPNASSGDRPSRSRSPPPPDPPNPGTGGPDPDADADADAEGDVEDDEGEAGGNGESTYGTMNSDSAAIDDEEVQDVELWPGMVDRFSRNLADVDSGSVKCTQILFCGINKGPDGGAMLKTPSRPSRLRSRSTVVGTDLWVVPLNTGNRSYEAVDVSPCPRKTAGKEGQFEFEIRRFFAVATSSFWEGLHAGRGHAVRGSCGRRASPLGVFAPCDTLVEVVC